MKKILLVFIISSLTLASCKNADDNDSIPTCIEAKINSLKNSPVQNPPAKVWKWEVDGQTYFYITSDCCDQYNFLYSTNCEIICAPDGGFTGKGDGKCPAFSNEITKSLVWEDSRQ